MLPLAEVLERTSLSKSYVYRLMRAGTFPRPVTLGPARVAWLEAEVNRWLNARVRERDGK
jgi:prophage regulatory protein